MKPFFSVIIPLYNKENFIINTLNSVLAQKYTNYEIIIIDDGSTDSSYEIVKQVDHPRIRLYQQKNKGVSSARNNGILKAKGDYIALLDADDYWHSTHLKELKQTIDLHPKQSVFCMNYEIKITEKTILNTDFGANNYTNKKINIITNYFESSLLSDIAWTSAICIKKTIITSEFLFDTSIKSGQDIDLWIRLGLNYSFVFNSTITATYNLYIDNSLSKSENTPSRYAYTQKYLKEENENFYLKKYLDYNRFSIALQCKEKNDFVLLKEIKSQINYSNLNLKQRIILNAPNALIKTFKKFKELLLKFNINISLYK